ncbi:ABC transporter ATP-binding protein [Bacillota bacterium LX-D]|nr:ABC transporter ATP-binding protein [Bacillota bacterium LX-D]
MTKIKLKNVTFRYKDQNGEYTALRDINLAVEEGEFLSVIGPSGCGKSTLISLFAGLYFPAEGSIILDGRKINGTGSERGVVFQHYSLFPWMTAKKNLIFGLKQVKKDSSRREIERIADNYLELVGLGSFKNQYPFQLSGGMQQRVAIARALAMEPNILLMDEPFGAVDAKNRMALQELLLRLWESGEKKKTVVFVTHDIDEAILLADRIIIMSSDPGKIKKEIVVPFTRPRDRSQLFRSPAYSDLRNRLVNLFYDDLLEKMEEEIVF